MFGSFNTRMCDFKTSEASAENHICFEMLNNLIINDISNHKLYLLFLTFFQLIVAILRVFDFSVSDLRLKNIFGWLFAKKKRTLDYRQLLFEKFQLGI